jgi:hypothetical protein
LNPWIYSISLIPCASSASAAVTFCFNFLFLLLSIPKPNGLFCPHLKNPNTIKKSRREHSLPAKKRNIHPQIVLALGTSVSHFFRNCHSTAQFPSPNFNAFQLTSKFV